MTFLGIMRRRRYSAIRLSVLAIAWITVFASPCSAAFMPDGHAHGIGAADAASEIHVHSHDKPAKEAPGEDCCCDQPAAIKAESPKVFKHIALAILPTVDFLVDPEILHEVQVVRANPFIHTTSPPVYLSTQRLRI